MTHHEDAISIELTLAERHTLTDLLATYINERAYEAVKLARNSIELEEAAERTRRLAIIKGLAEGADAWERDIPRADLDAVRADLMSWALETEAPDETEGPGEPKGTVWEHEEMIVKADEDEERSLEERCESIAQLRRMSTVDYAHKCVCERIIGQIDAAREPVAA